MPITPFHLVPGSFIGILLLRFISFLAFIAGNVIIDIEPFFVVIFNLNYPVHGYLHSFLGAAITALIFSIVFYRSKDRINKLLFALKLPDEKPFITVLISCISGAYFHVLLDSCLYTDIKPFFPFAINPFYGLISLKMMYLICGLSFIPAIILFKFNIHKSLR